MVKKMAGFLVILVLLSSLFVIAQETEDLP